MTSEVNLEQVLSKIPVVREYRDVFPEDMPKFPPKREVEFFIDLALGNGPTSIASYRMSSLKLAELKKNLEELLKFVRPSISP